MSSIKAGVVVINKFCPADSKAFSGYISYIDRSEAKRNEKLSEYNLYNDYMDNPEKTTGLFTEDKTELTYKDKKILKETFRSAQDNGSLMWQTVISFDNRWLEKYGLYDAANDIVDERKLKEISSNAIKKMLANEGLENAVWSGAIHYNTDNLHVHVAVVEPVPQRMVKEYTQYEYREDPKGKYVKDNYGEFVYANKSFVKQRMEDGLPVTRYDKVPLLDKDGNQITRKQYVGKFKQKSIEVCKQYVVNEIAMQRDQNLQINRIIREQIVKQKTTHKLIQDQELVNKFLDVYKQLPRTGNRGLWNYNNNAMHGVRKSLDELSSFYMQKYNLEDYKELRALIAQQAVLYREAYGKSGRDYEQTKMKDLYERLGNAILKEMREFDKNYAGDINELYNENHIEQVLEPVFTEKYTFPDGIELQTEEPEFEIHHDYDHDLDESVDMGFDEGFVFPENDWKMENNDQLRLAKQLIYGASKDFETAIDILKEESSKGNVLAVYELGAIYQYGRGREINLPAAQEYYKKSLEMFEAIYKLDSDELKEKYNVSAGYVAYRMAQYTVGRVYSDEAYGIYDLDRAVENFTKAGEKDNKFALYQLGVIYSNPENTSYYDMDKALSYFESSITKEFTNGKYKAAKIYLNREDKHYDLQKGMEYMQELADDGNDMAQYALGQIYEDRILEVYDIDKAIENYTHAANQENKFAQYRLGNIYADKENEEQYDLDKALEYFENSVKNEFDPAKYKAGKIYLDKESGHYDLAKGMDYMKELADKENDMAQYTLGRILLDPESGAYDAKEGMEYLTRSAEHGNEYAQLKLGLIYLSGADKYPGIMKDKEMARKYLELAAEKNDLAKDILSNIDNYRGGLPFVIAGKNRISLRGNSSYELEKALHNIEKSMGDELQKYINMREFEKLKDKEIREAEKEKNKEKDKEIDQEHE